LPFDRGVEARDEADARDRIRDVGAGTGRPRTIEERSDRAIAVAA
jgi:hypothetical protein